MKKVLEKNQKIKTDDEHVCSGASVDFNVQERVSGENMGLEEKRTKGFGLSHIGEKLKWSRLRADTHPKAFPIKNNAVFEPITCTQSSSIPNALSDVTKSLFVTAIGHRFKKRSIGSMAPATARDTSGADKQPSTPSQQDEANKVTLSMQHEGYHEDTEGLKNLDIKYRRKSLTVVGIEGITSARASKPEPDASNTVVVTNGSHLQLDGSRSETYSETTDSAATSGLNNDPDKMASAMKKRMNVIEELIKTEEKYVMDLKEVADGYMGLMRDPSSDIKMPEDLREGRDKMVFGNIETIYEWHRDVFSKALEKCLEHPEELGPLFKKYERKLLMYVVYCRNKPISEFIVAEHIQTFFEEIRSRLGHALTLADLLIKPVQRIMKYQLLLKEILKYTERLGIAEEIDALKHACHVMHVVPKEANDMMNVGRLQGFDGKISAQGKLIMFGPLVCAETSSAVHFKGKELQVFFFEQSIILSEAVGKKSQFANPRYHYKDRIQVNKMSLVERVDDGDPRKFMLTCASPEKPTLTYICQCSEKQVRDEWVANLREVLQTQSNFIAALQSPIEYYQKSKTGTK